MIRTLMALFGRGGEQVSPREAVQRMNRGAVLVDVREDAEFAAAHVRGAHHVPLGWLRAHGPAGLDARLPPGTRDVLLICRSGTRSRIAQSRLAGQGSLRCTNVAGGMAAWTALGLPVVRSG